MTLPLNNNTVMNETNFANPRAEELLHMITSHAATPEEMERIIYDEQVAEEITAKERSDLLYILTMTNKVAA